MSFSWQTDGYHGVIFTKRSAVTPWKTKVAVRLCLKFLSAEAERKVFEKQEREDESKLKVTEIAKWELILYLEER